MDSPNRASPDRERLVHLMVQMAAGDMAALYPFVDEFGEHLARTVRSIAGRIGRRDAVRDPDDLTEMVTTAALTIFDRAAGWDPERGAMPWTWAYRAIQAEVVAWIGHRSVELDESRIDTARVDAADPPIVRQADVDYARLTGRYPDVSTLLTAVSIVASPKHGEVHLQYRLQTALGDPSPSETVAEMFGLSPANVRKIDQRVRAKLSQLRIEDPTFAALRSVVWVEAC